MIFTALLAPFRLIVFVIWVALLPLVSFAEQPVKSIAELDISRYMGTWYEIAKLPNWFQRKCIQGTQAQYKILGPKQIEVTNKCTTATG